MTHKHKIKITDPNSFHHEFEDRTEIGGSYGEPTTLYMFLDDNEFSFLKESIRTNKPNRHDLALFNFLQSEVISKWHKYLIQYNFETLTEGIKIEIL